VHKLHIGFLSALNTSILTKSVTKLVQVVECSGVSENSKRFRNWMV
jgi:hypothetical protein